jgi:hypothetical protein
MATIKAFTDLSQNKTLSKILSIDTADMYWYFGNIKFMDDDYDPNIVQNSACWSLTALLKLLPKSARLEKGNVTELYRVTLPVELEASDWYIDPIDACYGMIIELYEGGYYGDQ